MTVSADTEENCDNLTSSVLPEDESRKIHEPKLRDLTSQILAGCIIHCIVIQAGINMAYSTIIIDGLKENGKDVIVIDKDQASWIASLAAISVPIGSGISGPLIDHFGRKKICFLSCCTSIISWITMIFAKSVPMIYTARMISGLAAGLSTVGLIYISEITHPQIRPMLLCFNSIFVSCGILFTYCSGSFMTWRNLALACLFMNFLIFLVLFYVPESPHWLLGFGNEKTREKRILMAEASLKRLNPRKIMYMHERDKLRKTFKTQNTPEKSEKSIRDTFLYYKNEMSSPKAYKPIAILLVIFIFQQLSGTYVVIFYAVSVFRSVGGNFGYGLTEYNALILFGILRFSMSIVVAFLSKKFKRKTLWACSGIGMFVSMMLSSMLLFAMLTLSYYDETNILVTISRERWPTLVVVLVYICSSSFGFAVIPWTLIGEILPISLRAIFGGFLVSYAYVIMFVVVKVYPYALEMFGATIVFFFFGWVSLVATIFVQKFLPETLGKSLVEIEQYFSRGKSVTVVDKA